MKHWRWLPTFLGLTLALIFVSADLSWAQCWGYGSGRGNYQVSQGGWGCGGTQYGNCSNDANYRHRARAWRNYYQAARGPQFRPGWQYGSFPTAVNQVPQF